MALGGGSSIQPLVNRLKPAEPSIDGQHSLSAALHLLGDRDSKANLNKGFLVLDIFGTPLRVRRAPRLSSYPGGATLPDAAQA